MALRKGHHAITKLNELRKEVGKNKAEQDKILNQLREAVEESAKGMTTDDFKTMPFMSDLRRTVIRETVSSIRDGNATHDRNSKPIDRKHRHSGIERSPELKITATPKDIAGYKAVEALVKLRNAWLNFGVENPDKVDARIDKRLEAMREAEGAVQSLGPEG